MNNTDSKYNYKRKRILEELDQNHTISNISLGMYDLTPYYNFEDFDCSLTEKILLNKNLDRKVLHSESEIFFSPPQQKAFKVLEEFDRVILSAPTSFGKTMLIKEYIYKKRPRNIVYIVPTNALAYELEKSFKDNYAFKDYLIYDKCADSLQNSPERKCLFVGTQEKYLELDKESLGVIDLFVIDEAYKLQDKVDNQRAYKLSATFLDSITSNTRQIFLLTPIAKLNGFENYRFHIFLSDFNVVEKKYKIISENVFFEHLAEIGSKEKTILFCGDPNQINKSYESIKNLILEKKENDFTRLLEKSIHPEWSVVKLLKLGILTHHGQMPKYIQNKMINLFNERNDYNLLLGTNSISEGINTVTKNLFIHPDYNFSKDKLLLKNTVGRAGRLGQYPIGYIYSCRPIEELVESEIEIELAISDKDNLEEITDSNNEERIRDLSIKHGIDYELCNDLIKVNKISLKRLDSILSALENDQMYPDYSNVTYIACKALGKRNYTTNCKNDKILIKGYLGIYYIKNNENIYLNNFEDRIVYYSEKSGNNDKTEIINLYMQFIYSTLEYSIMPIVNIGLEIEEKCSDFAFGVNVVESLKACRRMYNKTIYGSLIIDDLTDAHKRILSAFKDYGMVSDIKHITIDILNEIEGSLGVRYSTLDVINAIKRLSKSSQNNKLFYNRLINKYMI